ncbi:uncharacterized protein LOC144115689 [Amblyomma americanum]
MEASDVRKKAEPQRYRREHSNLFVTAAGAVVTLFCTAVFRCLRRSASKKAFTARCSSAGCEAQLLGDDVMSPSKDIHDYKCTSKRSGHHRFGRAFWEHAVGAAESLVRSADGSCRIALPAALLYKPCQDVAFRKKVETEPLRGPLGDVGPQERCSSWVFWCSIMLMPSMTNSDATSQDHSSFDEALEAHQDSYSRDVDGFSLLRRSVLLLAQFSPAFHCRRGHPMVAFLACRAIPGEQNLLVAAVCE